MFNGDVYDSRFLDPKRDSGVGLIIGLKNKDARSKEKQQQKKSEGFFVDYVPEKDGDTVTILDQKDFDKPLVNTPNENQKVVFETLQNIGIKVEKKADDVRFRISPASTPAFKRWFGDSKIVNEDGTPKIMYHGTAADITSFKPKQAKSIFVTDDAEFAENFAQMSENYMVENAERFMSQDDINQVYAEFIQTQTRFKSEKTKRKIT